MSNDAADREKSIPLAVDLDRTLVRTDLFRTALFDVLRAPGQWGALGMPVTRAGLKTAVARIAPVDAAQLPYDQRVLAFVRTEAARGRPVFLVTGAPAAYADAVARHLGLFAGVFASSSTVNLTGSNKARRLIDEFGYKTFDYIGDSFRDVAIWRVARGGFVCSGSRLLQWRARRVNDLVEPLV